MKLRIGTPRREPAPVEPGRPHPFRAIDDPGVAAMALSGGQLGFGHVGPIAATEGYLRTTHCGVPGCGKDRSDPIH